MIKVINVINTAKISKEDFEKLVKFYQNYDDEKFEIILVIPKNSEQLDVTELSKIRVIEIEELEKNIWNIDVLGELIRIFKKEKPYIVHSYESRMAELAAKFIKDCKVVFTGKQELINVDKKTKILKLKFWNELIPDNITVIDKTLGKEVDSVNKKENKEADDMGYIKEIQNMYEIMECEPKMKKINLLDVFIILVVLVACAVGYKFIKKTDNVITDDPTTKVVYQVRTNETIENVYDMIEVGTPVYESRKNYCIGKIIDKTSEPSIRYAANMDNAEYVATEMDGYKDIILTIEASADKGSQNIMIQDYKLKVGGEAYIKGKGYAVLGYVISIER